MILSEKLWCIWRCEVYWSESEWEECVCCVERKWKRQEQRMSVASQREKRDICMNEWRGIVGLGGHVWSNKNLTLNSSSSFFFIIFFNCWDVTIILTPSTKILTQSLVLTSNGSTSGISSCTLTWVWIFTRFYEKDKV